MEKSNVINDLHVTIHRAMGISRKLACGAGEGPYHLTKDSNGKLIMELFG